MFKLCLTAMFMSVFLLLAIFVTPGYGENDISEGAVTKVKPQKSDLIVYLKSLRHIIEFCSKHKHELDMNFEFGLFLVNVNLKSILGKKGQHLPKSFGIYIKLLLKENDKLISFFKEMVRRNRHPRDNISKTVISLFSNETQWINQIRNFEDKNIHNQENQQMIPSLWSQYIKNVDNLDSWVPSPRLSDLCMLSLANNKVYHSTHSKCTVLQPCYDMLINGTDFGYALSHRLLFLVQARHSRGCSIFSVDDDRRLSKLFCEKAYDEAKYIAMHSYGLVDLMLEQITLCALDGNTQFLQRHWFSNILQYQTPFGCFGQNKPSPGALIRASLSRTPRSWKLAKHRDHTIMGGLCNGHVTSVAAGALAAAVRYILEE